MSIPTIDTLLTLLFKFPLKSYLFLKSWIINHLYNLQKKIALINKCQPICLYFSWLKPPELGILGSQTAYITHVAVSENSTDHKQAVTSTKTTVLWKPTSSIWTQLKVAQHFGNIPFLCSCPFKKSQCLHLQKGSCCIII